MYGFIGDHRRRALLLPEVRQRAHFQAVFNPVVYKCMCTTTVCVAAANLKLKQLLFGLRRRRIYISRYIYLLCLLHSCKFTVLYYNTTSILVLYASAKKCTTTVDERTQPNNQRGRRHWLVKLLLFFSWKCCLIINKCVYVCVFSVWMSFIWRKRLLH